MMYALACFLIICSTCLNIVLLISPDPNAQLWNVLTHAASLVILFVLGVTIGERSRLDE